MSRYNLDIITPTRDDAKMLFLNTRALKNLGDIIGSFDVVYGFDNACGYFLQLFPVTFESENWLEDMDMTECYSVDSVFDGFSGVELAYFLEIFNGNKNHIDCASVDMPF